MAMTPGSELFSSPDPLNDSLSGASQYSRRVTRSQRSQRFISLASSSPRKQTFELEVGDGRSPQKLFVTVEAEPSESDGAARRLFTSPTPMAVIRRKERTTTTTVPVRYATDTEDGARSTATTPKRRGRPPKTAGTPKPTASTKKRVGTPMTRTPRQSRKAKTADGNGDETESEANVENTPKSATKQKRTYKRKTTTPSVDDVPSSRQTSTKRGRRRRVELMPEEVIQLTDAEAQQSHVEQLRSDVEILASEAVTVTEEHEDVYIPTYEETPTPSVVPTENVAESEPDIWMATLSDHETPRPVNRSRLTVPNSTPGPVSERSRGSAQSLVSRMASLETTDELPSEIQIDPGSDADMVSTASVVRDHDTIAQGEDFSMIFMDSIPSLHADLSVHRREAPQDFGETTSLIINRTLESLRQEVEQGSDDAMDDVVELSLPALPSPGLDPPEEAAPPIIELARSPSPQKPSPRWSQGSRKFKALPLSRQLLTFKAKQMDDSFSSVPSRVLTAATPCRQSPSRNSSRTHEDESMMYEDSFSEIPGDVLEAATPRRLPARSSLVTQELSRQSPASVAPTLNSDPGRLLTPEETPSPTENATENGSQEKLHLSVTESQAQLSPTPLRSSPPIQNMSLQLPTTSSQQNTEKVIVTPVLQTSPPQAQSEEPKLFLPLPNQGDKSVRPALSPIVRAGRALQSVTSDASSPMTRQNSLGSPFRGSVTSQAPSAQSVRSWNLTNVDLNHTRTTLFQQINAPQSNPPSNPPNTEAYDDPFGPETKTSGFGSFLQALTNSVTRSSTKNVKETAPTPSTSSVQATPSPLSDDGMSMVVGDSPSRAASLRASLGPSASQFSTMRANPGSVSGQAMELQHDASSDSPENNGDMTEDIWAIEAQRATPRSTRQQPFGKRSTRVAAGRRNKLPSPWTKPQAEPVEVIDQMSETSAASEVVEQRVEKQVEPSMVEEYSMVSQQTKNRPATEPAKGFLSGLAGRFDLSNFFSSPAPLPGADATQKLERTRTIAIPESPVLVAERPQMAMLQTSSMFPSIPRKEFRPGLERRSDLFSPSKASTQKSEEQQATSPPSPEQVLYPSVKQKLNFTPRSRQAGRSLFNNNPVPSLAAPTPPRMQLTHADIQRWQETSAITDGSPDFTRPFLRPLPDKNVSPSKSCLRSPLKPHTPGRVVEFASSTLSPLAQAQVRAARRASASSTGSGKPQMRVQPQPQPQPQPVVQSAHDDNKENEENEENEDISMIDASPEPMAFEQKVVKAQPTVPVGLSQTMWSRDHWILMDALLQLRRRGEFDFEIENKGFVRNSKWMTGRVIATRSDRMTLEDWHLDVIDAFKSEVGGWAEEVLAKRLFALIVGEEMRLKGRVQKAPTVKFY
jgi:serine/arginine repetitive matrix protein 2